MKRIVLPLAAALLCALPAGAQNDAEYARFQEAAEEQSVLYCGRQATNYRNIHFNGTFYWFPPALVQSTVVVDGNVYTGSGVASYEEFFDADIKFNDKVYYGVMANIDACSQELLVRYASGMPAVVVDREHVPWCRINGWKFVNLQYSGIEDADPGFYQVLADRDDMMVLKRVGKVLRNSADNVNGTRIGYKDPNYNEKVLDFFSAVNSHYLLRDGHLKKIGAHKAKKLSNAK